MLLEWAYVHEEGGGEQLLSEDDSLDLLMMLSSVFLLGCFLWRSNRRRRSNTSHRLDSGEPGIPHPLVRGHGHANLVQDDALHTLALGPGLCNGEVKTVPEILHKHGTIIIGTGGEKQLHHSGQVRHATHGHLLHHRGLREESSSSPPSPSSCLSSLA